MLQERTLGQRRLQDIKNEIISLNRQLESGEYAEAKVRATKQVDEALLNAQAKRALLDREVKAKIEGQKQRTAGEKFLNYLHIPKSLRASFDLSAPGRQGIWLAYANPDHAAVAFGRQLKAWADPVASERMQQAILNRPNAALYKRSGLYIATHGGSLTSAEEQFGTRLFPQWKRLNPFEASERAYVTYLNSVRADAFDRMMRAAGTQDLATATQIAQYVNSASGRGGTQSETLEAMARGLAPVLWSPRYAMSRIDLVTGRSLWAKNAAARKTIAAQYARSAVGLGAVLALLHLGTQASLIADPREGNILSTDYLKPKYGDTRLDVAGGTTQPVVATSRFITGKSKDSTGKIKSAQRSGTLAQQFRYKLAPTWSALWSTVEGKNAISEPFGPLGEGKSVPEGIWDVVRDTAVPLSMAEIVEAGVKDGLSPEDLWTLLNIVGVGVQTYKD